MLAAGLLWQQGCAGTRIQGDRNRNLPFCSDVIQFSRLDIARANRLGQANSRVYDQDKLPATTDKHKPGPTKQNCPEIRQLPKHLSTGLKQAWAGKAMPCALQDCSSPDPRQLPPSPSAEGNGCREPRGRDVHVPSPYSLPEKHILNCKNPHVQPQLRLAANRHRWAFTGVRDSAFDANLHRA